MSASTPGGSNAALPPAGGADPSMEDILASIRRILSEDEVPAPEAAAPAVPDVRVIQPPVAEAGAPDGEEVLSLDSSMLVEEPAAAPAAVAVPPPVKPPTILAAAPGMGLPLTGAPEELLGPAAAAAASSSVGALMRTLAERQSLAVHRSGPTLEDIVRDEMRPLLRAWLDENLPPLVERLVRAEIERMVGRAVS
jgi:cell pole-organizing protein PopZ